MPALTPVLFCRPVNPDTVSGATPPVVLIGIRCPLIAMLLRLRVKGSLVVLTPIALRDFSTTPKMIVPAGATVLPLALRLVASFVSNVRPGLSCDDNGPTIVTTMVVPAGMVAARATACPEIQKQNGRRTNVLLFGRRLEKMTVFMGASS